MYIKWIVCEVSDDKKKSFSGAQEKWKGMADSNGFLAQVGGWDIDNQNVACVIAFWETKKDLDFFMDHIHNQIFHGNKQSDTYKSITIGHFLSRMEMQRESDSLTDAVRKGRFLRIADCLVKPDRREHFERVQNEIWIPGMKSSNGMLGGLFSENTSTNNHYLVSTFWDEEENHSKYVKTKLPDFQKKADIKSDLQNITGKKIRLMNSWKVIR